MRVLLQRITLRVGLLVLLETALIMGAVVLSAYIRLGSEDALSYFANGFGWLKVLLIAVVCQICFHFGELYDLRHIRDRRELFVRALQALGASSFLLALIYYWFPGLVIGRGVFVIAAVLVIAVVVLWRLFFQWAARRAKPRERLLLVGTSTAAVELARELFDRRHELGVEIVGFVDPEPARVGAPVINPSVIGTIDDIPSIVRTNRVDRVVVSLSDARGKLPMEKLLEMKLVDGVAFDHLTSVYEEYTGKIAVENLRPSWLIFSEGFRKPRTMAVLKRAFDVTASGIGFAVAAPIMGLVALAVRLSSPGPALYSQRRVGQHDRVFTIYKFRSMFVDAEATTGAVWASKGDARITAVGQFLRRSRLDELPQLWNILRGDMSFVGPRPERPEFVSQLTEQIGFYRQRHVVKPGLTGWAQVRYTYGASIEDALEKLQYDLFYIKNMSFALDVFILLETVKTVVLRRGA